MNDNSNKVSETTVNKRLKNKGLCALIQVLF